MNAQQAFQTVLEKFPIDDYLRPERVTMYCDVVSAVQRHLRPGAKILDFGCGPCDKTAVLQLMGYNCSACDDLQDHWHKDPDSRDKILAFMREFNVDFRLADGGPLPFEKSSFDMVMLHDVLEHFHQSPRDLLNDLLEFVAPGGLLFVTVPNAASIKKRVFVALGRTNMPAYDTFYWNPGPWRGHVREYVRHDLVRLARHLNLEPLELGHCDHALHRVPRPLLVPYKCITGAFRSWKDSCYLIGKKRPDWKPKKSLAPDEAAAMFRKFADYGY